VTLRIMESLTVAFENLIELMKLNPGCDFTIIALDDFQKHPLMTGIINLRS